MMVNKHAYEGIRTRHQKARSRAAAYQYPDTVLSPRRHRGQPS